MHFYFATKNLQGLQIKVAVVNNLQLLHLFAALQLHFGCKDLQCIFNQGNKYQANLKLTKVNGLLTVFHLQACSEL